MFAQNIITQALKAPGVLGMGRMVLPWQFPEVLDYWDARIGVTAAGNAVSLWAPRKGDHNLAQATGANQPTYDGSSIITFDGAAHYLTSAITASQPMEWFFVAEQVTWTDQDKLLDSTNRLLVSQWSATPNIVLYAGSVVAQNADWILGAYKVISAAFNGASSSLGVNLETRTTGNPGAVGTGGNVFLCTAPVLAAFGNFRIKAVALSIVALSDSRRNQLIRAMALQHGVSL